MIIDVDVAFPQPCDHRVFRRIKVSGSVTLRALSDKILLPALGFCRNYHGYIFEDLSDGTCFGAKNSGAIDLMHMSMQGYYDYADDRRIRLADILHEPGAVMAFTYDLGDTWSHDIKLIKIIPQEESTGKCEVMDGYGMCPPEDSNGLKGMGCPHYRDFLDELKGADKGSAKFKKLVRELESTAVNYCHQGIKFDPEGFKVEDAQQRIKEAFRSFASVPEGAKKVTYPMVPGGASLFGRSAGRGQTVTQTPLDGVDHGMPDSMAPVVVETVADGTKKDIVQDTVCGECGNPRDLKVCSGCKLVRFCSVECQTAAWKAWHKRQCKRIQKS